MLFSNLKCKKFFKKSAPADLDYGPDDADVPDLPEDIFNIKKDAFLFSLKKTESEIKNIQLRTKGQYNNPLWNQERVTRLLHQILVTYV
jgi:hypothetical protein